jgi:acyl-CoA thioesterase
MSMETDPEQLARTCGEWMYARDAGAKSLGISIARVAPGTAETRMRVETSMVNAHDVCHGGYIFALADTAFAYACNSHNQATVAASASIEFLAPAHSGDELIARAREVKRGKRSGLYDIDVTNQDERRIALFRGRSAGLAQTVIPAPESA